MTQSNRRMQRGGSQDNGEEVNIELMVPVQKLWRQMARLNKQLFDRNVVASTQSVAIFMYKVCSSIAASCKEQRSPQRFAQYQALRNVLLSMEPINTDLLDNPIFVEMCVSFLQTVFFPIGRMTEELQYPKGENEDNFIDDFVKIMNSKTRKDYIVNYCNLQMPSKQIRVPYHKVVGTTADNKPILASYTCGRAISAIPYTVNIQENTLKQLPRIVIHNSNGVEDDTLNDQDAFLVAQYLTQPLTGGKVKKQRMQRKKTSKGLRDTF